MNVLFITGSLEPGRDGVGDYTRKLAAELIKQGYKAVAVAVNDPYVNNEMEGSQHFEGIDLPVLRIPANWMQRKRFKRTKEWIDLLNPEWLSLQFVIFSFHSKGIPFRLSSWLKWLGKDRHWHIMFHELWVGMDVSSSKKLLFWGLIQKKIIKRLIIQLSPRVIHTQTRLYQAQLAKLGFTTDYLPLFGNIPVVHDNIHFEEKVSGLNPQKAVKLVIFGAIHPGAPLQEFANEVANYSNEFNVPVSFIIVGHSGSEKVRWANVLKSAGMMVEVLGEQSAECISKILSVSSLGISTTPIELAEKSGTIAAMREHGLPVLCVTLPWIERHKIEFKAPSGIFKYSSGIFKELMACKQNSVVDSQAEQVAIKFTDMVLSTNK